MQSMFSKVNRRHCMALAVLLLPATDLTWAQSRISLPLSVAINHAGKIRALSQRFAKAYVQSALGVLPDKAHQIMLACQREWTDHLKEMDASSPPPEVSKLIRAAQKETAGLGTWASNPSSKTSALKLASEADALLEAAEKLTKAYEGLSTAVGAKIVNIAGRQRMLSQRAARGYFLIAAEHDTPDVHNQILLARQAFGQSMVFLQGAPISTSVIRNELDLAKNQWMFFENSLTRKPDMENLQTMATTSERLYEVMDNLTALYDAALRDLLG